MSVKEVSLAPNVPAGTQIKLDCTFNIVGRYRTPRVTVNGVKLGLISLVYCWEDQSEPVNVVVATGRLPGETTLKAFRIDLNDQSKSFECVGNAEDL